MNFTRYLNWTELNCILIHFGINYLFLSFFEKASKIFSKTENRSFYFINVKILLLGWYKIFKYTLKKD